MGKNLRRTTWSNQPFSQGSNFAGRNPIFRPYNQGIDQELESIVLAKCCPRLTFDSGVGQMRTVSAGPCSRDGPLSLSLNSLNRELITCSRHLQPVSVGCKKIPESVIHNFCLPTLSANDCRQFSAECVD